MKRQPISTRITSAVILLTSLVTSANALGQKQIDAAPPIPLLWDDAAMAQLELPTAVASATPRHVPGSYYYSIPVRTMVSMKMTPVVPLCRNTTSSPRAVLAYVR